MSGFWTCHECGAEMYGFENCQFCGAHKGGGEAMSDYEEDDERKSYHVEKTRFNELPREIIVREDGYMWSYRNESKPIVDYVYVLKGMKVVGE